MVTTAHLAQLNVARLLAPLDDPRIADFIGALDRINALAEASPGFVWRLQSDSGNATDIRVEQDPLLIVNLTTWKSLEALFEFTYRTGHNKILARRRDWFERAEAAHLVHWWVRTGHRPSLAEALARLDRLRRDGPTPAAFTFKQCFPPVVEPRAAVS